MSNTGYQYSPDHEDTWREIKELLAPLPPETVREKIEEAVDHYCVMRWHWGLIPHRHVGDRNERLKAVRKAAKKLNQTIAALPDLEREILADDYGAGTNDTLSAPVAIIRAIDEWLSLKRPHEGRFRLDRPLLELVGWLASLYRDIDREPEASKDFLVLIDDCLFLAGEERTTEPKTVQRYLKEVK